MKRKRGAPERHRDGCGSERQEAGGRSKRQEQETVKLENLKLET